MEKRKNRVDMIPDRGKTILFDFDGTLADTPAAGVVAFNALAARRGFMKITQENVAELRTCGPMEAMKILKIPSYRAPLIVRALRKGVSADVRGGLAINSDLRFTLFTLVRRGYRLGIVTSNSRKNVETFLKKNNIEIFDYIHARAGIFCKARAIKKMMDRNCLVGCDVVFVGDEIRDIEAAKRNRIGAVAVTWGLNSREGFAMARPDAIVETPLALAEVLCA